MPVDTLSLEGKIAIVTGSGRENGIGAAIATALARNGAAVTINYVSEGSTSRAKNVAENIRNAGGKVTVIRADVSDPEEAKRLVNETMKTFGTDHVDIIGKLRINICTRTLLTHELQVNNAGYGEFLGTLESSKELVEKTFAVDVHGPIFLTQAAIPHIATGGRIINISSVASKLGLQYLPVYGAAKAAIDSLTFAWAIEVSSTSLFGNAVLT